MRILLLEDDQPDAALVRAALGAEWPDTEFEIASTRADLAVALARGGHEVIISDFSLGGLTGLECLQVARRLEPDTPFIFFSGTIREETAVEAMRDGAADYVLKDRPLRLVMAVRLALQKRRETEQRRRAEVRVREQNELLDRAHDAIIVTGLDHRILSWNQGASRLLGWTAPEVTGERIERFLDADAFSPPAEAEVDDAWHGEVEVRAKDGRRLTLETHMTLVRNGDGSPRARVAISTDITERNRLKEQFFRAQRLESLGLLAAGIAHDLNNVLAPMLMAPALLRARASDPADLRLLDVLQKSAERGSALVRQILSFARGTASRTDALRVDAMIADLAAFIRQTFPRRIELEESIPEPPWTITGSATQIHQVLLNLCINARDAMPEGGKLGLKAENAVLSAAAARRQPGAKPGRWVRLTVADSGTGMPPEVAAQIWEPFFTTKAETKGSGLGLSTVRGIVDDHGGFITVDTAVGRGSSFHIHLPAGQRTRPTVASAALPSA